MPTATIQTESGPEAAPDVSPPAGEIARCGHAAVWAFDLSVKRVVRRPCPICAAEEREEKRLPEITARAS